MSARGVPLFSPEGYRLCARGPAWREHPDYYHDDPPEDDEAAQYEEFLDTVAPGGLSDEEFAEITEHIEALSKAALTPWPPSPQGGKDGPGKDDA